VETRNHVMETLENAMETLGNACKNWQFSFQRISCQLICDRSCSTPTDAVKIKYFCHWREHIRSEPGNQIFSLRLVTLRCPSTREQHGDV